MSSGRGFGGGSGLAGAGSMRMNCGCTLKLPIVTPCVSTQKNPACSSTISARNHAREELKACSGGKAFTVIADIECSPRTLVVNDECSAEGLDVVREVAVSADLAQTIRSANVRRVGGREQ